MEYLKKFLIIFFAGIVLQVEAFSDDAGISLETNGYWRSLINFKLKSTHDVDHITDHGKMFANFAPVLMLNDDMYIKVSALLSNYSFSSIRYSYLSPEVLFNAGNLSSGSFFKWNVRLGNVRNVTVGHGLTIKDFNDIGGDILFKLGEIILKYSIFSQGYSSGEDINHCELSYNRIPVGINVIYYKNDVTRLTDVYYEEPKALYFLPFGSYNFNNLKLYTELGIKVKWKTSEERSDYFPKACELGLDFQDTIKGFKLNLNPEMRYYQKKFIPNLYLEDHLHRLDNYYHTSNNWIDFFLMRQSSWWFYLRFSLETPSLHGVSIFGDTELLYINTKQKFAFVSDYYGIGEIKIIDYKPSTIFYNLGIKYSFRNSFFILLGATNKAINDSPYSYYSTYRDPIYKQYGTRFVPIENTAVLLSAMWDFALKKRFKNE